MTYTISPCDFTRTKLASIRVFWVILLGFFSAGPVILPAAPPPNDLCENAIVIPSNGPFPYLTLPVDIADATIIGDPATNSCRTFVGFPPTRSTWFQITPEKGGAHEFSVCSDYTDTTVCDTIMAVYTSLGGCSGPFVEIANGCDDDSCGCFDSQSTVLADLDPGMTYFIVVWQLGDEVPPLNERTLQLITSRIVVPPNDICAGLEFLPLEQAVLGSTVGANNSFHLDDSDCFDGDENLSVSADGNDVVYGFIAPAPDFYSFKVSGYSTGSDLVLYVASQCPATSAPALVTTCLGAANRNPVSSTEAVVCLAMAESEQVYIFVDENNNGTSSGSTFVIEASRCRAEIEPNDTPATATLLANSLVGSISQTSDVDFFHLGIPGIGSRVFAMLDAEASSVPDFDLRVISDRETLEYDNDNNDSIFGDTGPNLAGTILSFKPAFLRINFNGVVGEPYFLYAVVQPPLEQASVEVEPNDMITQAFQTPQAYYSGSLAGPSPSDDVDIYAIEAQPGDLIYLAVDGDPLRDNTPINPRLELLDDLGNVLVSVNDTAGDSSTNRMLGSMEAVFPKSPAESLVYPTLRAGTYYARVSIGQATIGPNGSGDYLLSVSLNLLAQGLRVNRAPVIQEMTAPTQVVQGETVNLQGLFQELDFGQTHLLSVDWGDGTGITTRYLVDGDRDFQLNHVYDQPPFGLSSGEYWILVLLRDHLGGEDNAFARIRVDRIEPARFISITPQPDDSMVILFQGAPLTDYLLQSSSNANSWTNHQTLTADQEGIMQFTDGPSASLPASRFYRAIAP